MTRLAPLAIAIVVLSACSGESATAPTSNGAGGDTVAQMLGHWDFSMGSFQSTTSEGVWDCDGNGTLVVTQQNGAAFIGYVSANEINGTAAVLDCLFMQDGEIGREVFTDLGDFGFDTGGNPLVTDTGTVHETDVSFTLSDFNERVCTLDGTLSADASSISGTAHCTMPFGTALDAPFRAVRREGSSSTPNGARRAGG